MPGVFVWGGSIMCLVGWLSEDEINARAAKDGWPEKKRLRILEVTRRASQERSTAQSPERQVRAQMGESPSLRQQRQTAGEGRQEEDHQAEEEAMKKAKPKGKKKRVKPKGGKKGGKC